MILTEDVDTLDTDGLVRRLGEVELLRRRLFRRLDGPATPAAMPAPATPRGASLTVREVMERLKVSRSFCYRAIKDGRLPAIRLPNSRNVRVPESALAKLEKTARVAA